MKYNDFVLTCIFNYLPNNLIQFLQYSIMNHNQRTLSYIRLLLLLDLYLSIYNLIFELQRHISRRRSTLEPLEMTANILLKGIDIKRWFLIEYCTNLMREGHLLTFHKNKKIKLIKVRFVLDS